MEKRTEWSRRVSLETAKRIDRLFASDSIPSVAQLRTEIEDALNAELLAIEPAIHRRQGARRRKAVELLSAVLEGEGAFVPRRRVLAHVKHMAAELGGL